ncbi:Rieske 2Fe-2S domain-containing protein [Mesorhizobium sp. M8A.F.Ca.ET.057.01.1.1]|uniref:Rieske 2Fe-2S domain-containing protein n=1 Tax=Mesorhizobium sp. M8A.F.Ca.ET.057.01.1.1 TaxID=2493679 RepID=UPI0026902EAA
MFLRNCWYVAAWDHEVADRLMPTRILGEDIVLFRRTDGVVAALEDACPHRKLPLSMGRIKGDTVECGYHGLTFDSTGTCTRVPGAEKIPHVACVRSYPIAERYGLLWIWMGEAAKADPDLIFAVDHWGDPAWGVNRGESMALDCNYLYMTDNLLDPSHVSWVHQSSFGGVQAMEDAPLETTVGVDGVTVWRWVVDAAPAPFYAPSSNSPAIATASSTTRCVTRPTRSSRRSSCRHAPAAKASRCTRTCSSWTVTIS